MKLTLTAKQIGNSAYPRYGILCECGIWFRKEGEWTPDPKRAALYASLHCAKEEWKRLQKELESGLLVLTATVVVKIKGVEELTQEQIDALATYLAGASTFTLDYTKARPTWLRKAIVSCQIIWNLKK
jgi:hypothetical protein